MIKQPVTAPNSVPTPMGWLQDGVIVHKVELTPAQINEWCEANNSNPVQMLNEVPNKPTITTLAG
jgi:hypothetical protein